jgi:hypothetical protein
MGSDHSGQIPDGFFPTWDYVAYEGPRPSPSPVFVDKTETWEDESVIVCVEYGHGKAVLKFMEVRVPQWKVKTREWLNRLRGLVGW